ncbi:enoyl-CoA delta isomerase 1, peroxisomal-like [Phragmites australis]|uniref:enoyl-CoA delta isomerase 1, peroxisomal-like n=1 Tax=Phragmites australis TaxID=29695 RepID=UPI002D780938|nr:enoyl-CoA delta isomerase 1, peroxisomal-like [Phragmites australis]
MGFCEFTVKDGIFVLTLDGGDGGHNYLTLQSMADLKQKFEEIRRRARPWSKGLITTCSGGAFCHGVDYGALSQPTVDELSYRMAEVLRLLFEMPFPTAAAVTGDVKSSLALALVMAHDDTATLKEATIEMPEVRDGHDNLPPYVGALLRDKVPYPLASSSLLLCSEAMKGSRMKYWDIYDGICDDKEEVMKEAIHIVEVRIGKIGDGRDYITTRKSFFPESWKAVSQFLGDHN